MKTRVALTAITVAAAVLAAISCRRSDIRTAAVDVPDMSDARSIRIVTNAALAEVVGEYDGIQSAYEIDLSRKLVLYHESHRLLSPEYQRRIEGRIAEVGFAARVMGARHNPPPPVPTSDGPAQMWPGRFTAVISVRGMKTNTDANVIVDAIAYARVGRDDPRVTVRPGSRRIVATYESLCLSLENIEHAIACAGFDANTTLARLGAEDCLPHGWTQVRL